jgi:hypothetical protein
MSENKATWCIGFAILVKGWIVFWFTPTVLMVSAGNFAPIVVQTTACGGAGSVRFCSVRGKKLGSIFAECVAKGRVSGAVCYTKSRLNKAYTSVQL